MSRSRSTQCDAVLVTEQISQRELSNDTGRVIRELDRGRSFVITRNGRPIGELRPLRRDRFVGAEIAVEAFRSAPAVDATRFHRDLDQLIAQASTPRA